MSVPAAWTGGSAVKRNGASVPSDPAPAEENPTETPMGNVRSARSP